MTILEPARHINVTPQAADTIRDMVRQAQAITEAWRDKPELALKAHSSLTRCLGQILSESKAEVFRDGDLSLVYTSFMTIGVIYHRAHPNVKAGVAGDIDNSHGATYTGRYCMETVDGKYCATPYTWKGDDKNGTPTCEGHTPFPVTMPVPGDWSTHS